MNRSQGKNQLLYHIEYTKELSDFQSSIITDIWSHFLQSGEWPRCCNIHVHFNGNRARIRKALDDLGGSVVQEIKHSRKESYYHLTALGCILAADTDLVSNTLRIIETLRDKAQQGEFDVVISNSELVDSGSFSETEAREFFRFFLRFRPIGSGCSGNIDSWEMAYGEEIDELMSEDNLIEYFTKKCINIDPRTPFEYEKRDSFRKHILYEPRRLVAAYHCVIQRIIKSIVVCILGLLEIATLLLILEIWLPGFRPIGMDIGFAENAKLIITIICVLFGVGAFSIVRKFYIPLTESISGLLHRAVFRSALLMRWEYYFRIDEVLNLDWDRYTHSKAAKRKVRKFFGFLLIVSSISFL